MKKLIVILLGLLCGFDEAVVQESNAQEAKRETVDRVVKTPNFIIDATSPELAREIATEAEKLRKQIAVRWIGREMPSWSLPCLLFVSTDDKPWGWTYHYRGVIRGISIRGTRESIFNHSLPHELTHAIIISHYGCSIPRWFDEGLAVSNELDCPHRLKGKCGDWPLSKLFNQTDYPVDWESFYGQSYSVTSFLVERFGFEKVIQFARKEEITSWDLACISMFQIELETLDAEWRIWHKRNFVDGRGYKITKTILRDRQSK